MRGTRYAVDEGTGIQPIIRSSIIDRDEDGDADLPARKDPNRGPTGHRVPLFWSGDCWARRLGLTLLDVPVWVTQEDVMRFPKVEWIGSNPTF